MNRCAKIVCTLGPASASLEQITALTAAGMDIARMNFSHGTHADHQSNYDNVRAAAEATGRTVGVLADLQGPKIRLGKFADGAVIWTEGDTVVITTDEDAGEEKRIGTTYPQLAQDVEIGDRLLIDDGNVAVVVTGVAGRDVQVRVVEGGTVSDHKGLSLPGVKVSVPALSEKDARDLRFALRLGVDFVALSFVRHPEDAELVRDIMREEGLVVPVIAKLEKPEAIERLDEIVESFDGVMVARGDLGVELPLEEVPLVQKRSIQIAREKAKPVIVATQMLDSMITHSRPTRAEASDVANAVLDGADAVMLSGETSVGQYPVQAVETMARIICSVEAGDIDVPALRTRPRTNAGIIARSARDVAEALDADAIAAFTQSGDTVRRLARHHSKIPVLAFTPVQRVRNQLALSWGVRAFIVDPVEHTDEMVKQVDAAMLELGVHNHEDLIVMVAGSPPGKVGSTNLIRLHRIGEE
ncbi:pyruvate kinase [Cumulibacter manganitolerans]|uniref:pyruvate kinase n=1 Tax=Cumulibacter manganitolerans TaxID=1884992 RepID=UPI001297C0D2|nr:pyruvate kinase [Cumulibacter manganitolerans]